MLTPITKLVPGAEQETVQAIGTIHSDAIPLFVHEKVLEEILDYSETDLRREVGGFLIGGVHNDRNSEYVEIRRFLPATDGPSSAASFTFTPDSWARMHRVREAKFPDDIVVGWHHTHPDLGVFLSGYDLFIHKHFFSQHFEVALVVDPKREEFGFFQWRQQEITDCGFVCVYE